MARKTTKQEVKQLTKTAVKTLQDQIKEHEETIKKLKEAEQILLYAR